MSSSASSCPAPSEARRTRAEHAELVVCDGAAGVKGSAGLHEWIDRCRTEDPDEAGIGAMLTRIEKKDLGKVVNADVSITLHAHGPRADVAVADGAAPGDGGPPKLCVKFHQRPLREVVAWELANGKVEAVPDDYFSQCEQGRFSFRDGRLLPCTFVLNSSNIV